MIVRGELEHVPLLEIFQVLAFSGQTGALIVDASDIEGTVVFERGAIVCGESSSTRSLLAKAARQSDPQTRRAFQRVQTLAALTELLSLRTGAFRFEKHDEPMAQLAGVDLKPFYAAGPMATVELLLVLATSIDKKDEVAPVGSLADSTPPNGDQDRAHPRYSPTLIEAELGEGAATFRGYLTNVSVAGAFFNGESLPEVDAVMELRFELPGGCGAIATEARVAWARTNAAAGERGVGLALESMTDADARKLGVYLDRFQQLATDMDLVG